MWHERCSLIVQVTLQSNDAIDHYDTKSKFSSAYDASPNPSPSPFLGNGKGQVLTQSFSSPSPNNFNYGFQDSDIFPALNLQISGSSMYILILLNYIPLLHLAGILRITYNAIVAAYRLYIVICLF